MRKQTKINKAMLHIMRSMGLKENNQAIYKLYQHKEMDLLVSCVIRIHILFTIDDWWIVELYSKYSKELFDNKSIEPTLVIEFTSTNDYMSSINMLTSNVEKCLRTTTGFEQK